MIHTIGHGARPIEAFLALLAEAGVGCLVDVRAFPASRRHPQFERAAIEAVLGEAGIGYRWEGKALGGRRRPAAGSPHVALKNAAFRAYADHMATPQFREGMERLAELARDARTCIMCAETLPWKCHRSLISDTLVAGGAAVFHIMSPGKVQSHVMSRYARRGPGSLIYDAGGQPELEL